MRHWIQAMVLTSLLASAGCSRVYVYAEDECRVVQKREDGTLLMECYDKSLRKDSKRPTHEPRRGSK